MRIYQFLGAPKFSLCVSVCMCVPHFNLNFYLNKKMETRNKRNNGKMPLTDVIVSDLYAYVNYRFTSLFHHFFFFCSSLKHTRWKNEFNYISFYSSSLFFFLSAYSMCVCVSGCFFFLSPNIYAYF